MHVSRFLLALLVTAALVALVIEQFDFTGLVWWAAQVQRDIQNAMAGTLRAIQAGEPAALLGLCGLTFAYGFAHAIGPGHGKVLIAGAALARRAKLRRLALLTLAASIGQSLAAVLLVLIGAGLVTLTSGQLVDFTERSLAPISYAAVGLIGAWLALRGARGLWRALAKPHPVPCDDSSHQNCGCGHRHAPSLAEIDEAMSLREMVALVLSIALRPCTGALFLLVIAWRLHILPAGIFATFAMGLGTASFNLMVAGSGLGLHVALSHLGVGRISTLFSPLTQLFAGLLVIAASGGMLMRLV